MRHIFFLILSCALGLCVFFTSEQAQAQGTSGTISIYTYRTVTTRLTNENERLSNVAVTERKNAAAADQRWRRAMLQLEEERTSGSASAGRVAQLEKDAADRELEFESAIESLNAQLAIQNDEFQRALRAATAAGTQLLQSEEGQRALELIALGGEESTEAGIQILLAEQEIQDRVDKLRIADRARTIAFTLLGLKGSAPSATTASIINQYDIVIDNDPSRHSDWVQLGDLYFEAGRHTDAARAARRSLNVAETERDLAVSYQRIGEVEREQGDLTGARESYRKSLAIRENLAAADPSLGGMQRGLIVSYIKIGDVEIAQGDLTGARESYRKALAIGENLAAADPSSAPAQRDLFVNYERIGKVEVAQGDLTGARESYRKALAISKNLAAADPSSTSLRRDLFVSYVKVGDVEFEQGDLTGAGESYRKAFAIAENLAAADPSSARLQRDLSLGYGKIGKVEFEQGDLTGAGESYRKAFAMAKNLAAAYPSSAKLQRDLSVHYEKIGDVELSQGDLTGARESYRKSLAIRENLAAADPSSASLRRDIFFSYGKIGDVKDAQGDLTGARESYRKSLAIAEDLAAADPSSARLQLDLSMSYRRLALLGDPEFSWSRVVERLESMTSKGILFPADQHYLDEARRRERMELEAMQ